MDGLFVRILAIWRTPDQRPWAVVTEGVLLELGGSVDGKSSSVPLASERGCLLVKKFIYHIKLLSVCLWRENRIFTRFSNIGSCFAFD